MSTFITRSLQWCKAHIPTREQLESNRFMRPFAHHLMRSELWVPTRRSIPRGVALGLFVGVMIPLAHFIAAAFLAIFVRANIPAALAATFIGFPAIYPALVYAADKIGSWLLRFDAMTVVAPINQTMQKTETGELLAYITRKGPAVAFGLFVLATAFASIGYIAASLIMRWRLNRKLEARRNRKRSNSG